MTEVFDMINVNARMLRTGPVPVNKVSPAIWLQAAGDAARGRLTLLSLWGSRGGVYMALHNRETKCVGILRVDGRRKVFPSVGALHPPAQRLERAIADIFGIHAEGSIDARPWLDHGKWPIRHPLGIVQDRADPEGYRFLPVQGDSLHQVAVGPVHAGVIEPGHFRFTVQGETVVRLEQRFGYAHKGTDGLMAGATIDAGAKLAARTSGDSTVAYGWAYAQAVEAALEVNVPERAFRLRAVMAELERLANHLGNIGGICNDAAFGMMLAQCSRLRERVLRVCDDNFGHRFMRDIIIPGGVGRDLDAKGCRAVLGLVDDLRDVLPSIIELYDRTASLLDRTVAAGILAPALAQQFGAGGYVGRASGRDFDTRRDLAYAPYDLLKFEVALRQEGDVNARVWVRIDEIKQSLSLISQILHQLPEGPINTPVNTVDTQRQGLGLIEGFRGDILIWLSLNAKGRVVRCHMRDPSWFQWPLLEAAIEGNIIADFPLCNKSFNCSYSGPDL